jgi:hypothetical protein
VRARILQIAAAMDRVDRAEEMPGGRAEEVQQVFSLPYDNEWRTKFNLVQRS